MTSWVWFMVHWILSDTFHRFRIADIGELCIASQAFPPRNSLRNFLKGLGVISPKEFKQFIGPDIRLQQVSIDRLSEVPRVLEFYMGKNTPDRNDYIMANLVDEPV